MADNGISNVASVSASLTEAQKAGFLCLRRSQTCTIARAPSISRERAEASLRDRPFDLDRPIAPQLLAGGKEQNTVLYLAYGSNLQRATFLGKRGIRPISQVNVVVPELRLTFDLPGFPYSEPCFANSSRREPQSSVRVSPSLDEKTPLLSSSSAAATHKEDYHKDRWHKGLVGCVYELTVADFAHVIATEGGGSSYQDILVDCYALMPGDYVPEVPDTDPFKVHTLYSHVLPGEKKGDRTIRPDPSYAQPSERYMNIIKEGAAELDLPREYRDYIEQIRPYHITTNKQRLGQYLIMTLFGPLLTFLFGLNSLLSNKAGRSPGWLTECSAALFKVVWIAYDGWFKEVFGDGERTMRAADGRGGDDQGDSQIARERKEDSAYAERFV